MAVQNQAITQTAVTTSRVVTHSGGQVLDAVVQNILATSQAVSRSSQTLRGAANATTTMTGVSTRSQTLTSVGKVVSLIRSGAPDFLTSTALILSQIRSKLPQRVSSTGEITSNIIHQRAVAETLTQNISMSGETSNRIWDTLSSSATITERASLAAHDRLSTTANVLATVLGGGNITFAISDEVIATSRTQWQGATNQYVTDTFHVASFVGSMASTDVLVVNSNSGAVSRYDRADIITVLYTPNGLIIVTADGFATPDYNEAVNATLSYAPTDYGRTGEFRLENLWADLQGGTDLSVTLTTHGGTAQTNTYPLESRNTSVPRTSRFVPGRGMVGRYWAVQIQGTQPFNIVDLATDIAESRRRV